MQPCPLCHNMFRETINNTPSVKCRGYFLMDGNQEGKVQIYVKEGVGDTIKESFMVMWILLVNLGTPACF